MCAKSHVPRPRAVWASPCVRAARTQASGWQQGPPRLPLVRRQMVLPANNRGIALAWTCDRTSQFLQQRPYEMDSQTLAAPKVLLHLQSSLSDEGEHWAHSSRVSSPKSVSHVARGCKLVAHWPQVACKFEKDKKPKVVSNI